MRRNVLVVAVLAVLAFALVGGPSLLASPTTSEIAPETASDDRPDVV